MHLLDVLQGKAPLFKRRSPKWKTVRDRHLKRNPFCAVCGGTKKLRAHHVVAFHADPSRELDPTNLITLCESRMVGISCHRAVGHLGSYKKINPLVRESADYLYRMFRGARGSHG